MDKCLHRIVVCLMFVALSGCARFSNYWDSPTDLRSIYKQDGPVTKYEVKSTGSKKVTVKKSEFEKETIGTLMTWDSDVTGAVINGEGQTCVQSALTSNNLKSTIEASISDAVLQFKLGASDATKSDLIAFKKGLESTVASLRTTTERTAALNVGLYYLCQLSMNNHDLSAGDLMTVYIDLVDKVSKMKPTPSQFNPGHKLSTVVSSNENEVVEESEGSEEKHSLKEACELWESIGGVGETSTPKACIELKREMSCEILSKEDRKNSSICIELDKKKELVKVCGTLEKGGLVKELPDECKAIKSGEDKEQTLKEACQSLSKYVEKLPEECKLAPAADKPAADKPAADKPAADKPAADKPAADKPAADKPAADKPVADKPVADKPADIKRVRRNPKPKES